MTRFHACSRMWLSPGLAVAAAVIAFSPTARIGAQTAAAPIYGYAIVNSFPHDPSAYTQGLIYRGGFLYESTGRNGRSTVRKVRLDTGEVVQQQRVDDRYFAEGLTEIGGQLIQLTWQSNIGFVYDLATLASRRTFSYTGEGWGLTEDGRRLILSDGSSTLRFFDPTTFRPGGQLPVTDQGKPISALNELEWVHGEIYANVWHTDRIARISPVNGQVVGWIDLAGILPPGSVRDPEAVLNGIAFDPERGRLFVTGKLWPRLFEIRVVERAGSITAQSRGERARRQTTASFPRATGGRDPNRESSPR